MPSITLRTFGVDVQLNIVDANLLKPVVRAMPPDAIPVVGTAGAHRTYAIRRDTSSERETFILEINGSRATAAESLEDLLDFVRPDVRAYVTLQAPDHVFVHAGAVSLGDLDDRRVILLPGYSHAGKSTLVSKLLEAGATYYSDDFAPIDFDGRVHPFPVPLRLRSGGNTRLSVEPPYPGSTGRPHPARLALVLFTEFQPGGEWDPQPISTSDAVHRLLPHTPSAATRFGVAVRTLKRALDGVPCMVSPRGEATDVVARLMAVAEVRKYEPVFA